MIHCRVIAIGKNMPTWVDQAWKCYAVRLQHAWKMELIEIAPPKRQHAHAIEQVVKHEAAALQAACLKNALTIALDRQGKHINSLKLAEQIDHCRNEALNLNIMIGGPEGIDPALLNTVDQCWSLSELTMAHTVARVVLAEQLFRAWSILQNHPYHR